MITLISGCQGAGKSLYSIHLAKKWLKRGRPVYSNCYIKDCYKLELNWFDFQYEEDSLIIIDEAQLNYNCRDYSTKTKQDIFKKMLVYLTMCRHYDLEIIFITQSINRLDVQIRDLCTSCYRFIKTYKLPFIFFKKEKPFVYIKFLPIFQRGRYFEDVADVDRYLSCTTSNYKEIGSRYFRFINPFDVKLYDSFSKDINYLVKPLSSKTYWQAQDAFVVG